MRSKSFPVPRIYGTPKSEAEAIQLTSQPQLNTIVQWICRVSGYTRFGNTFHGSFGVRLEIPMFTLIYELEAAGFTINEIKFVPLTLRDLNHA